MIDKNGSEGVYFCMLALFQLLCDECLDEAKVFYETFYKKHPKIKNTFPFDEPLLNLAHFLFAAIEKKNADTFMILYQNYSVSLTDLRVPLNLTENNRKRYKRQIRAMRDICAE